MKKILILILALFLFQINAYSQSASDMLERVLSSVVTVAVEDIDDTAMLLGYRGAPASVAYESQLDLGDAFGSGSGFVVERGGRKYVVTNSHVVEYATEKPGAVVVYSINRTRYEMDIIGGDNMYDIAILAFRTTPGPELSVVDYKRTNPRIGEPVYAVGNPRGDLPYTISDGIIGALNRHLGGLTAKFGYLQSTATIFGGNSGGPLFDRNGDVIGINTFVALGRENNGTVVRIPQVNYALEPAIAKRITDDVIANNGRVRRAFLGVELTDNYEKRMIQGRTMWQRADQHPVITGVLPNSPASSTLAQYLNARVTKVNGTTVRNIEEVFGVLEFVNPGSRVTFELVMPGGNTRSVDITTQALTPEHNVTIASQLSKFDSNASFQQLSKDQVMLTYQGVPYNVDGVGIENIKIWRVNTVNDLGVGSRFAAMGGVVEVIVSRPGQEQQKLSLNLSGNANRNSCILWY
jgi:S1-C subfamily serine protease